jgi:GINS complex subunit 2
MATNLKLKKKCHIVPPDWLNVGRWQHSLYHISPTYLVQNIFRNDFHERPRSRNLAKCPFASPRSPKYCWTCKSHRGESEMIWNCLVYNNSMPISSASDDFQNPDKIRSLLKDIREARQAKSREGLSQLDHSELSVCTGDFVLNQDMS